MWGGVTNVCNTGSTFNFIITIIIFNMPTDMQGAHAYS